MLKKTDYRLHGNDGRGGTAAKKRPMVLAVIPARGGSQRLRNKHTRLLLGKPLIAYAIAAARAAKLVDAVLVSTDSPAIASAARRAGATVVMRPARLATANSPVTATLTHAMCAYEALSGTRVSMLVLLQATTPTTIPADIDGCVRSARRRGYDGALTVFNVYDRPEWCGTRRGRYFRKYFSAAAQRAMSRQRFLMAAGGVYAVRREYFDRQRSVYPPRCGYVVMPPERNTDIDTLKDYLVAEMLLRRMRKERKR